MAREKYVTEGEFSIHKETIENDVEMLRDLVQSNMKTNSYRIGRLETQVSCTHPDNCLKFARKEGANYAKSCTACGKILKEYATETSFINDQLLMLANIKSNLTDRLKELEG